MPNQLDANGLQVASLAEIIGVPGGTSGIIPALQAVFGSDINVAPNTPDGNLININAQPTADMLELLLDVYNILFVDSCYGTSLDNLVALNGIARNVGSYTQTPVQVTVPAGTTLPGLDTSTPMTIPDDAGNQWQLVESYTFPSAGTATLMFQSTVLGQTLVTTGTIVGTIVVNQLSVSFNNPNYSSGSVTGVTMMGQPQVTSVSGGTAGMTPGMDVSCAAFPNGTTIISVDSSSQITLSASATSTGTVSLTVSTPPTDIGVPEENDVQLKIRRAQSFNLQTVGPSDAVQGAISQLPGVASCFVAENNTGSTVKGVPAYSIWVIVNGGTASQIGQAIYAKKSPGCGMKGSQTYSVARPQGNSFTAQWDNAIGETLYIEATINSKVTGETPNFDTAADAIALAAALIYGLGQSPSIGDVILAMQTIEPDAVLSDVGVSVDNTNWESIVTPSDYQHYFTVAAVNITLTNA